MSDEATPKKQPEYKFPKPTDNEVVSKGSMPESAFSKDSFEIGTKDSLANNKGLDKAKPYKGPQ